MSSSLKLECLDNSGNPIFYVDSTSGVNITTTTNSTSATNGGALTVNGGASFGGDVYIGSILNVNTFRMDGIVTGISTIQSASFSAANNVSSPTNITGLSFSTSDIRSFNIQMTVSVNRSVGGNLFESFTIEGIQNDSGWALYTASVGDISGVTFSITNDGQMQYTSNNYANWTSTTFRYSLTKISNSGTYQSLSGLITGGSYQFDTVQINNTASSVLGNNNGGLYLLGGATFEKNLTLKETSDAIGFGSGGSLTVLGGVAISSTLIANKITSANIISTNITSGTIIASTGITGSNSYFSNITTGNAIINTNLVATGDSNTLGNIFTTGGNVGIKTTSPGYTFDVNGNINFTGNLTQNGVVFVGGGGSSQWTTYGSNIAYTTGNVGIGTTSPSYPLHVIGNIFASGDITAFSDSRLKSDVQTIDNPLDKIDHLRGVYYTNIQTQKRGLGVIAQEINEVIPEVIADDGEYLGVAYGNLAGLFIEAIKELKQELNESRDLIFDLQETIKQMQNK